MKWILTNSFVFFVVFGILAVVAYAIGHAALLSTSLRWMGVAVAGIVFVFVRKRYQTGAWL